MIEFKIKNEGDARNLAAIIARNGYYVMVEDLGKKGNPDLRVNVQY